MKTITKKSLSLVLAMLMALSCLTMGSISAFASSSIVDNSKTAVAIGTNTIKENYVKFTPSETAYYNIAAEVPTSATSQYVVIYTYNSEYDYTSTKDSFSSSSYTIYSVVNDAVTSKTVYSPAQETLKLAKGETYYIKVNNVDTTNGTALTIAKNDFEFSFTTYDGDLTYKEGTDTVTSSYTVGIGAAIKNYYGSSTEITYPSTELGYKVVSVKGNDDDDSYYSSLNTYLVKAKAKAKSANTSVSNVVKSENFKNRVTKVVIPEGVTEVYGFEYSYALSSVTLPSTLKEIGSGAFAYCHSLKSISMPANIEKIYDYAFYDTGINSVEFVASNSSAEIYPKAFGYVEALNEDTTDPTDTKPVANKSFFMIAPAGTITAHYATTNNFACYDRANCTAGNHSYVLTSTTPATIFAAGKKVYTCPVDGVVKTVAIAKKTFAIKSLKSSNKNIFLVKVAKQSSITGYKVQYSTSKKFSKKTTKTVTVKTKKALSKSVKGLTSGKKYYVRVRAYKVSNKKTVYSKYTATKTVTVK